MHPTLIEGIACCLQSGHGLLGMRSGRAGLDSAGQAWSSHRCNGACRVSEMLEVMHKAERGVFAPQLKQAQEDTDSIIFDKVGSL